MSDLIRVSDIVDPAGPVALARAELRDRFAMAALTGFLAENVTGSMSAVHRVIGHPANAPLGEVIAAASYAIADAMLAERERTP